MLTVFRASRTIRIAKKNQSRKFRFINTLNYLGQKVKSLLLDNKKVIEPLSLY